MAWILFLAFKRYVPILGMKKYPSLNELYKSHKDLALVDIRDFQTSFHDPIEHAYCLPLPYLYRNYQEIKEKQIILIVSDHVERNLSARLLQNKGFKILGYYVPPQIMREENCCLYEI